MPRAPRRCPFPRCTALIQGRKYCQEHTTAWEGSTWVAPPRWRALRAEVLERDDYRCHLCGGWGADTAHHLIRRADGGTDTLDNLVAVHDRNPPHCHRAETNRQRVR